mmetsp:Transcript_44969/g.108721  ORF Transcript_44969/g.108721 Transcript_44969/m.108721 type:complete len:301 (-) Transcript_44969:503-1405(-)
MSQFGLGECICNGTQQMVPLGWSCGYFSSSKANEKTGSASDCRNCILRFVLMIRIIQFVQMLSEYLFEKRNRSQGRFDVHQGSNAFAGKPSIHGRILVFAFGLVWISWNDRHIGQHFVDCRKILEVFQNGIEKVFALQKGIHKIQPSIDGIHSTGRCHEVGPQEPTAHCRFGTINGRNERISRLARLGIGQQFQLEEGRSINGHAILSSRIDNNIKTILGNPNSQCALGVVQDCVGRRQENVFIDQESIVGFFAGQTPEHFGSFGLIKADSWNEFYDCTGTFGGVLLLFLLYSIIIMIRI